MVAAADQIGGDLWVGIIQMNRVIQMIYDPQLKLVGIIGP